MEVECPEADEELRAARHAAASLQGGVLPGVTPHLHAGLETCPATLVEARVAGGEAVALYMVPVVLEAPEHPQTHAALAIAHVECQFQGCVVPVVILQSMVEEGQGAP